MEAKFDFAKSLIWSAGEFLKAHMNEPLEISEKTDMTDLVTDMDRKVQEFLMTEILENYPEDRFFAEEDEQRQPIQSGKVWVIDPIDGTSNFVAQKTDFAIVLAYFEDGVGQFGLIYDVMAGQLFYGGGQFDVYCNDRLLTPYEDKPLHQSLMITNTGLYQDEQFSLSALAKQTLGVRSYGSAALSMARVFSGLALGYFAHICPWDYAAAKIMGDKLGYLTQTLTGEPLDFNSRQYVMMVPQAKLATLSKYIEIG